MKEKKVERIYIKPKPIIKAKEGKKKKKKRRKKKAKEPFNKPEWVKSKVKLYKKTRDQIAI